MKVRLESLTKFYGKSLAIDGLSLEIQPGERIVLLGASGCGKTTLLRLIAGLVSPDRGKIYLNGRLASSGGKVLIPPEDRNIGFVFQDLALWPHLTVYGNLEFGLKAKGIRPARRKGLIQEVLVMVGLEGFEDRGIHQLSGGQKQRVALARTLVLRPGLILMDEPLSSLDWELKSQLIPEILRLQGELGFSMVYVTHDREEAKRLATRILVMKDGHFINGSEVASPLHLKGPGIKA